MHFIQKPTTLIGFLMILGILGFESCSSGSGDEGSDGKSKDGKTSKKEKDKEEADKVPKTIRQGKGVGPVKKVDLTEEIKGDWTEKGKAIHGQRCASCHKLTDKQAVGPGWAGITNRRKPEWIMNMIMNTSEMLVKDPEARKQLEECATRMPNQNLSEENARKVLEFMRKNDLEKTGEKDKAA